jgi:hypothetical protein
MCLLKRSNSPLGQVVACNRLTPDHCVDLQEIPTYRLR